MGGPFVQILTLPCNATARTRKNMEPMMIDIMNLERQFR
jgi:hypothetical protein